MTSRAVVVSSSNTRYRLPWLAVFVVLLGWLVTSPVAAQLVLNEILASNRFTSVDEDGDSSDWIELYNAGPQAIDLDGYALSDDPADLERWIFPAVEIESGGYLLVWCSGKDRTGVPSDRLSESNSSLPFEANLASLDDSWHYLAGAPEDDGPPGDWMDPDFDDSAWPVGVPGFGFGRSDAIQTETPAGHTALFLRHRFEFQPGQENLVLQIRFDDGFVAFLNGEPVAAKNASTEAPLTFGSRASRSNSSRTIERFDLTPWLEQLVPGTSVLAIAGLNSRASSRDLVVVPELGHVPAILHASFELRAEGEPLFLVDPQGRVVDEVVFPPQSADQSYARSPDGNGRFLYHLEPTPLAANSGPASVDPLVVGDTTFSVDRGFYDEPFQVAITTSTDGARIYYTLDGSEPGPESGFLYEAPVPVERTTVLRAIAVRDGFVSSNVDTQTYIFLDDVLTQGLASAIELGLPRSWGTVSPDYGMDSDVIGPGDRFGGIYAATIHDDLRSLPTMSIVVDPQEMFGPQGIYTHSTSRGPAWERAASAELITPDGSAEFQVNCGIRIQGGYFRQHSATRKHSLRLLFKAEYGPTKLEFPLFGEGAVDRFDTITLRAGANDGYSWNAARLTEQYTRDEFGRRLQIATGNPGAHGMFVHLYINGVYWGLYNPVERPDHSFSASYFGGDKDDWDSLHDLTPTEGDGAAWAQTRTQTQLARTSFEEFMALQGRNPDGTPNPDLPHLLDVPNYIDYLLVNIWGGNWDWPWKNWWAARQRTPDSTGFKFYCWDYENTIGNNRNRSPLTKNALANNFTSAGEFHVNLRPNPEYRQVFGDRAHRLLFNGGVLTPESLIPRYAELAAWIERAIVGESARWGDQHFHPPLTLREWENERDWVLESYLPRRSDIVLNQLRSAGLYPRIVAPTLQPHGGQVEMDSQIVISAPGGTLYYTTDGSDPRLPGGEVSPLARVVASGEGIAVDRTMRLRTRARVDGSWSALDEADFVVDTNIPLRVSELMYHPANPPAGSKYDAEEFEFIELVNVGSEPIDLRPMRLRGGVTFEFSESPIETLHSGGVILLVENERAFASRYDTSRLVVAGQYSGRLSNGGEALILEGYLSEPVLAFEYRDAWYPETDGGGHSLVVRDLTFSRESWGIAASWKPSDVVDGTPGEIEGTIDELGGLQRPGDVSQDGRLNISDVIVLLRYLFAGDFALPPCQGATIADGANRALADINGDAAVDPSDAIAVLEFLFLQGAPPSLGIDCVRLPGCADVCR